MSSHNAEEDHFSLLCNMAVCLENELLETNTREYCSRCERPIPVCICAYLPKTNITLQKNIKIWIFQHPHEEKRTLRTTRILEKCLDVKNFQILIGKKFSPMKFPELEEVYQNINTFVLYPSPTSITLEEFRKLIEDKEKLKNASNNENQTIEDRTFHIILIDGTWDQASGIYWNNEILQELKQIKINASFTSNYIIRTQPRENFLSTLETVSIIVSTIENKPQLQEDLIKPLRALCEFQIQNGAMKHHSKEYLIVNGQYDKPISKRNVYRLTKDTKLK